MIDLSCALLEEPNGALGSVVAIAVGRDAQPVDVEHPLALDVQPLSRRGQDLHVRRPLDHPRHEPGILDQVLEVVEHEQRRAFAQVIDELVLRREAAVRGVDRELERFGDRRGEEVWCHDGGKRDEVDPVRVAVDPPSRGFESEPGLADASGPHERQQTAARILEQPVDLFQLLATPDERCLRRRQVRHPGIEGLQERELRAEPIDLELVDPLRGRQIFEAMGPEIAHRRVHQRVGRLREEDLPAVTDSRDAGALVDVEAYIPFVGEPRLAAVKPHTNLDRPADQRLLRLGGGSHGIRGSCERDEERVALGIDLDAVVAVESPRRMRRCSWSAAA